MTVCELTATTDHVSLCDYTSPPWAPCFFLSMSSIHESLLITSRKMANTTLDINKSREDIAWYWFRVFFITITAFLDIFCNSISLILLPKTKSLPSNNRFLVMISSLLDLTTGFVVSMSVVPAILGSWPYGEQMCPIYVISRSSSSCTTVILVIGALDRYIAI